MAEQLSGDAAVFAGSRCTIAIRALNYTIDRIVKNTK